MNILMFGRGGISTQYAWAFEKAGHQVEFYVRPGRIEQYGPIVNLNLLDGRKSMNGIQVTEKWPITMRESLDDVENFDLIIVSVNPDQIESAARMVGKCRSNAAILIFNNLWDDFTTIRSYLPEKQVVFGFPGAGGGYTDENTFYGGLLKPIFLEAAASSSVPMQQKKIAELFKSAGFLPLQLKGMQDWLWGHYIMNVAMGAESIKKGGYVPAFADGDSVKEMILLMREMTPLIIARGGKIDFMTALLTKLPMGISAYILKTSSAGDSISGKVLEMIENTSHASAEMADVFVQSVLKDAAEYHVSLPLLRSL